MIITDHIKELVLALEASGLEMPAYDRVVRELIQALEIECAKPINKKRYASYSKIQHGIGLYPLQPDGYAVSFDPLMEEDKFVDTWFRYGVVVGKTVVSPEQCHRTVIWIRTLLKELSNALCDIEGVCADESIPRDRNGIPLISRGFFEIYHDDMLAKLRQTIRLYIHHVLLWGRTDLWTSFDRLGLKLPNHHESKALPLHVDQNPRVHLGFKTIQGVLALVDCPLSRGTLKVVPGSKSCFEAYVPMAGEAGEYVELNATEPFGDRLYRHAQALPIRSGDIVSWDSRTTHANTENYSNQARMVAYIAAGPAREEKPQLIAARMEGFESGIGSNVREALMHASKPPRYSNPLFLAQFRRAENLTLLGKLLYGQEKYTAL